MSREQEAGEGEVAVTRNVKNVSTPEDFARNEVRVRLTQTPCSPSAPAAAPMADRKRLRVTFVVDLDDIYGDLPEPGDENVDIVVCECLLEMLTSRALIYLDNPDEPVELSPVGWSVEAGGYGDMQLGTLRSDLSDIGPCDASTPEPR